VIVLSPIAYHRKSGTAIICAITSRIRKSPFEVLLPPGLLPPKAGVGEVASVIVADAVRQVDYRERECAFVATAPRRVVEEVMDKLLAVLEDN
jgi:mRNA-degrading endonuclease toxin of MazEF toxin-antitoxin module